MKFLMILMLLILTSCNPINKVRHLFKNVLGIAPDDLKKEDSVLLSTDYKIAPPPSINEDKIVEITPRKKLISFVENFALNPDEFNRDLLIEEFIKQKDLIGLAKDEDLNKAIFRMIPLLQEKSLLVMQLVSKVSPVLKGETKEAIRFVWSRGFDTSPGLTVEFMSKTPEEMMCNLSTKLASDVSYNDRINILNQLKPVYANQAIVLNYIDQCIKTLEFEIYKSKPVPTPAPVENHDSTK